MKIIDKIVEIHCNIYKDPLGAGGLQAEQLQQQSVAALLKGQKSAEWETYMSNFATEPGQLERLKGEDPVFNEKPWAETTLAYLVANATCGIATTTGTKNNMTEDMIDSLDS